MNNQIVRPRVSILFPVYNTAQYLREAVDSMLAQTFEDFELIVLNDCSPDNAEDIIDTYHDPRIVRYRGEKNVGLANVLNVGIAMARGEYIARMDSDDISLPERLKVQVDFLDTHSEYDLVSVGMKEFGDGDRIYSYDNETEEIKFNALFYSPILHASSMWRRQSFEGLLYDQSFVPSEDYHLWTRALLKGITMRNLPEVLYRYRRFGGQATSNNDGSRRKNVRELYIQSAFPDLEPQQVDVWVKSLTGSDLSQLKKALEEMDYCNKKVQQPFFQQREFGIHAKRYYQSRLFKQLMNGGKGPVFDLRISQIMKLMKHRLCGR